MSKSFSLIIATPEREVYRDTVESLTVPTIEGEITILPHHLPLSTVIKPGEVTIRQGSSERPFAVGGGFLEVHPDNVVLQADAAEHVAELDAQRAEEAVVLAEQRKLELTKDHEEYAAVAAKLERDLARLRIIRKHRGSGLGIPYQGTRRE